jgi:small neutral amino acid transporter SnatA (MarC family)
MSRELSLFIGTFTTLLAIINPLEVLPVYLKLLEGKDVHQSSDRLYLYFRYFCGNTTSSAAIDGLWVPH